MPFEILVSVYILAIVLGLCIGSFLNVVIYRLPENMSLSKPGSHCTKCGYFLKWYDNVPVLSYIMLGGKCRKCKTRISPRYIGVELLNAGLWLISAFLFAESNLPYAIITALLCSVLICVFFIDLKHLIIFDRFHIIIAFLGILAIFFDKSILWSDRLIGALSGGALFLAIYFIAILIYKKEGMGFGDVKLFTVCGLFLGWQKLILVLLLSTIIASIVLVIVSRIKKNGRDTEYPFGPFIALAVVVAVFVGDFFINWYISLLLIWFNFTQLFFWRNLFYHA